MMRDKFWLLCVGSMGVIALPGCGSNCGDDGWAWLQADNPACLGAESETNTATETDATTQDTVPTTGDPTEDPTQGSVTMGGGLWCADVDGDGFGDPNNCQDEMFPGSVPNADDCDDSDANTFPGAAENESDTACMKDTDGDGWGDSDPPPGVMPGTDCDDNADDTFPGAAENESDTACMKDTDGDGWGDNNPGPGVDPGTDCDDSNEHAFPGAAENESDTACMQDADGDGYGDSDPGRGIEPGTDCDDQSEHTFPGAAPNDDPEACMKDVDGDDWGDSDPPPGVVPGTDCDDNSSSTFPGAAFNEENSEACMKDDDGDGWGDNDPPEGVTPGIDCDDMDPNVYFECVACEPPGRTKCEDNFLIACGPGGNVSSSELCEFGCDPEELKCLELLTVEAGPSLCIDAGEMVQLEATAMGGAGNYSWDWTPADTLSDALIPNPVATPAVATTYTVTVTDGVNNQATDNVSVFIKDAALVLDDVSCKITNFAWDGNGHAAPNWNWNPNLQELCQVANSRPTARFCGWSLDNASLQGRVQVKTVSDDDYVGFLWGIQPFNQDIEEPTQFYFFSWKQTTQLGFCAGVPTSGRAGMLVKRINVQDPVNQPLTCADFHGPEDTPNAVVLATEADFSTTGWADNTPFIFDLTHTPNNFTVRVLNADNMNVVAEQTFDDATYPNGQVGFYAYSQEQSCFSNFKTSCL